MKDDRGPRAEGETIQSKRESKTQSTSGAGVNRSEATSGRGITAIPSRESGRNGQATALAKGRSELIAVKLSFEELKLLTTLASDQLFRREFIDPKMPGFQAD